jgi:hypothetical protein
MLRRLAILLVLLLAPALGPGLAHAEVPAGRLRVLAHGINLTNWFRFPARQDDAFLRTYISDAELAQLRQAGFTFVRLAVQPDLVWRGGHADTRRIDVLIQVITRIERHGLGVMVGFHPHTWQESLPQSEQRELADLWGALAVRLRPLSAEMTFPEVMNEPIYPQGAAGWEPVQARVLARIRAGLPDATVVLTGTHWSAVDGLVALHPVADTNVVYTFHYYDPTALTTLGAFEPTLDHRALRALPFPVTSRESCEQAARATTQQRTIDVIRFYCSERWDDAKLRAAIAPAADWARRNHAAVVCGEFGASSELPASTRLAWIAGVRRALEADDLGWALWGYDDSMGFHVRPHGGAPPRLDPSLLHALGLHG